MTATTAQQDRRHFIGGSDAAAILGISPWKTPLQLWQQKTQPFTEPMTESRRRVLTRGHRMEPYVVELLAEERGLKITKRNRRYIDREFPFIACEIDAETKCGKNVEIKTVSPFKAQEWGELDTDAIPVHYTAQAQHGLMVRGREVCVFGVLIGGDDFRVYEVRRDDEIIAALRQREVDFWLNHIVPMVPPPVANGDDTARLFPKDLGTAVEATTETLTAYNELKSLLFRAKQLDAEIELHRNTLRMALGGATRLTLDGRDLVTWKAQSNTRFDVEACKTQDPELYARFLKTTETRVLRLR